MNTPIERFGGRLRTWGMGERVLKTTLAVMLAWMLGTLVPGGTEHPYFAPLAALLSFQVTIADSITAAAQRILGIVAGVIVALVVTHLVGESVWGVGLLVFLALVVGANLHLTPQGVSQVATSALIVMFVGGSDSLTYAGVRIIEGIIGAAVGVGVNALLVPPTYLPAAREAMQRLAIAVARHLEVLAGAVNSGLSHERAVDYLEQARALNVPLGAAQAALERANISLKYNLLQRSQQSQLAQYRQDLTTLEHSAIQVRSISRALVDTLDPAHGDRVRLDWSTPSPLGAAYGALLAALAVAVVRFSDDPEDAAAMERALATIEQCRQTIDLTAQAQAPALTPEIWMHLGAVLASAERMRVDLSRAITSP